MEYLGIDVHQGESQICRLTKDGEIIEKRIVTRADRFEKELGSLARARILIETSTESEWVARVLEQLGHEVVVADPNFAPMYATRGRRVKTDRRDAQALMDACRLGAYRASHRTTERQRRIRSLLAVRDMRAVMAELNTQMLAVEKSITDIVAEDPVVQRLCTAPGIGPVTAVAFVSTLDLVQRFEDAHKVQAYIGLVPSELSSGERQHRGAITKTGNTRLRWLLVEAAWSVMRSKKAHTEELRLWALTIAARRGPRIAIVALGRKLAGILYAMWRDETVYGDRSGSRSRVPAQVA